MTPSLVQSAGESRARNCEQCGCEVQPPKRGRPAKYCKLCRERMRRKPAAKRCCERCGKQFTALSVRHRFCSKHCSDMWHNENNPPETCRHCGKVFPPKASDRTSFCSRECAYSFKSEVSLKRRQELQERKRIERLWKRLAQHSATIEQGRTCELCGTSVPRKRYGRATCDECKRALVRVRRRRARVRREQRERVHCREYLAAMRAKFKRTHGQCKLCGQAITLSGDPNSDRRCEFDHKVPLGVGGKDTIDNIQAICRKCNGLKHAFTSPDVVIGQWLKQRLVGA